MRYHYEDDLATALQMPLFIVSYMYFFANCRKTRLLIGAVAGQTHNVQLMCKTGIEKAHLSTQVVNCYFELLLKYPNVHTDTVQYLSITPASVHSSGAINIIMFDGISHRKVPSALAVHGNYHESADWNQDLALEK